MGNNKNSHLTHLKLKQKNTHPLFMAIKRLRQADSDIDICVVDNYTRKSYRDKLLAYSLLRLKSDIDISVILFSEKDLKEPLDPLAAEVRKWGVEVYNKAQKSLKVNQLE